MPRTALLALMAPILLACARGAATAGVAEGAATEPALPRGVTADMVTAGGALFNEGACVRCHGQNGRGGNNGPSLTTGPWLHGGGDFDNLVRVITTGVPRDSLKDQTRRFAMNPRGGPMNLTDEQARTVAAYVWSISRGKTSSR